MGKSNKIAKVGFKKDEMPIPGLNIKSKKIKKLKHNKIKKNREREILLNLNIDMSEILKKEMSKLSLENKNIDNQLQNAKIAAKMNYLSKYGRDYKNKYLEDIGDLLQNERQLSRGQRKRAEKKAKFVRKQLMHEKLVKKKKDQVKEQKKQKDGLKDKEENTAMVDGEGEIKQNITESIQGKKSKKRSNKPKNKMKGMKDIFNDMNLGVTKSIKKSKKARKLEKNNELYLNLCIYII